MSLLPRIKHCPCCGSFNLLRVNSINYENTFISLQEWILKKKFKCRKCKAGLGLFIHSEKKTERIVWFDFFNCEDHYFSELNKLLISKDKIKKQTKKYSDILNQINKIQNQIRNDQVKVKIKYKIEHKGLLI
tara:strand:+ start:145 stop:540 length:396 start_codon:yes stop_codon:yes gene_type:complete